MLAREPSHEDNFIRAPGAGNCGGSVFNARVRHHRVEQPGRSTNARIRVTLAHVFTSVGAGQMHHGALRRANEFADLF